MKTADVWGIINLTLTFIFTGVIVLSLAYFLDLGWIVTSVVALFSSICSVLFIDTYLSDFNWRLAKFITKSNK